MDKFSKLTNQQKKNKLKIFKKFHSEENKFHWNLKDLRSFLKELKIILLWSKKTKSKVLANLETLSKVTSSSWISWMMPKLWSRRKRLKNLKKVSNLDNFSIFCSSIQISLKLNLQLIEIWFKLKVSKSNWISKPFLKRALK